MWISAFRSVGTRWVAPALAASVLCSPVWAAGAAGSQAAPEDSQSAVWTQKELTFVYQGFTTRYSCDGLRDKVRGALLDLGVQKKDLKVSEYGCSSSFGRPDPFPGVRVKMSVLEPAGSSSNDTQVPVQAHWKPVDLKLNNSFSTDSGECELVEQIKSKILPLLSTRNVDLTSNCIPHQASATRPTLKMEVLVADQKEDKASPAKATTAAR